MRGEGEDSDPAGRAAAGATSTIPLAPLSQLMPFLRPRIPGPGRSVLESAAVCWKALQWAGKRRNVLESEPRRPMISKRRSAHDQWRILADSLQPPPGAKRLSVGSLEQQPVAAVGSQYRLSVGSHPGGPSRGT